MELSISGICQTVAVSQIQHRAYWLQLMFSRNMHSFHQKNTVTLKTS